MDYQPGSGQDQLSPRHPRQEQQPCQGRNREDSPIELLSKSTAYTTMKTYTIYYTTSRTNAKLHLGSFPKPCVYYMESNFTTSKPQLQLRSGDSKSAPMVAFAKIHLTSRHILLGSGDYQKDSEDALAWEEMRREKFRLVRSDYEFDTSLGSGVRRTYGWRVENYRHKTIYKCVDDAGQIVATLLSGGMYNWRKGGEIEIAEGLEAELEALLIVSALAIWTAEAGWSVCPGYSSGQDKVKD